MKKPIHAKIIQVNPLLAIPWILIAAMGAFLIYLVTAWMILEPEAIWSPDEGAKLLQLLNIRYEESKSKLIIPYAGRELDPELNFALAEHPNDLLSILNNQLTLERLPIFPILNLPFYQGMRLRGIYILPAIAGAAIGALALGLIRPKDRRFAMWILIAFGSPVFIYSILFWEHTLATALGLAGVWLIFRVCFGKEITTMYRFLLSLSTSLLLSAAIYLRLELLFLAGSMLISCYLLDNDNRKWILLTGIVLVITLIPYQSLHMYLFSGHGIPTNARYLNYPLAYLKDAKWKAFVEILIGPINEISVDTGWLGIVWAGVILTTLLASLIAERFLYMRFLNRFALGIFGALSVYFLLTPSPYRAAHGLLFTTPWLLLGVTQSREMWRNNNSQAKTLILATLIGLACYIFFLVGFRASSPHGGMEWGSRFALSFYPLLAIIAAWDWQANPPFDKIVTVLFIILGIGFQIRGIATIRNDKQINANLNRILSNTPEEHIITDLWWLLLNAAPTQPQKAYYVGKSPFEISDWIVLAANQGVNQFNLVTLNYGLPMALNKLLPENELTILELIQVENLMIFRIDARYLP